MSESASRDQLVKLHFMEAVEFAPEDRAECLVAITDRAVREEVQELLAAHDRAGNAMGDPSGSADERAVRNTEDAVSRATARDIGRTIGRYSLIELIGEGGFGRVYRAQQHAPVVRDVAIKIIRLGMDTREVIARFELERQAMAMMRHPGIAQILDAGETDDGLPYVVMELIHGVPITDHCRAGGLPIAARIDLFLEVCAAVQHAHTKGVIHRDIKPSNVLVASDGDRPQPKVIDFGIARAANASSTDRKLVTEARTFLGTPQYMSPEQAGAISLTGAAGGDIDTRTDVYALGALLYELLTDRPPFDGDRLRRADLAQVQRIIRDEEPVRPGLLTAAARGDLEWITAKAMEKDRERRYESAAALADDIRRHLKREPVLAGPPSAAYRMHRFVARHRARVAVALVMILLLMLGTIGTTIGMVRSRAAAREAGIAYEQAAAVNEFLREILTSVEPDVRGADVRFIDVLENASLAAAERFRGYPQQEASVRVLLAQVLTRLDLQQAATDEYRWAIELYRGAGEPDSHRLLYAEAHHVRALINQARYREAESWLEGLSARINQTLGDRSDLAFECARFSATLLAARGLTSEAEAVLRGIRTRIEEAHPHEEADSDALQIGVLNALIRTVRRGLGTRDDGDAPVLAEFEQLAVEMVRRSTRLNGPTALPTMSAETFLAEARLRRGDAQSAAELCTAMLLHSENRLGTCHSRRLETMAILAESLLRMGDVPRAAQLYLTRIDCMRAHHGVDVTVIGAIADALPVLHRAGLAQEGEILARELAEGLRAFGGGHGSMLLTADTYIARFLLLQGRSEEAGAILDDLLVAANHPGFDPRLRARMHLLQAEMHLHANQPDAAEAELLLAAACTGDIRSGTCWQTPDDLLLTMINTYEAMGRTDMADAHRRLAEEVDRR